MKYIFSYNHNDSNTQGFRNSIILQLFQLPFSQQKFNFRKSVSKNIQRLSDKLKNHKLWFVKAKYPNSYFPAEQTWLLLISVFRKSNLCSQYEHKFYARNPQKASAFLRGKTLLKNMSKTPESKMRITRFFTFILFFIDEKSVEFLKTHKIKIATLFLRFANI